MPIIDYEHVGSAGGISIYKTTMHGNFSYYCGCGHTVDIKARSDRKEGSKIRFEVSHRNRSAQYVNEDPCAHVLLEKMIRVCTYAKCGFPLVA